MDNRKRRGRIESLTGKIFILSLFLVLLINLIVPDKEQSEQENRMLETMPKLSLTGILTGDFMEQWESYMSDQFAGRNQKLKVAQTDKLTAENAVTVVVFDKCNPDAGQRHVTEQKEKQNRRGTH